jgi:pimeloyl-ACP methyl ester carboxylesterase
VRSADATGPRLVRSVDGTPIAVFAEPGDATGMPAAAAGRPILLVHGTTADHTTFRVLGPRLAPGRPVLGLDRRGRGASGDTLPYAMAREVEDVAAVATDLARRHGVPIDLLGHSFGGRCVLGAARLVPGAVHRIVSYEGAIAGSSGDGATLERLDRLHDQGRWEELLETFLREVVGMTDEGWATFRTAPVWPARLAAAPTVTREVRAGGSLESDLRWLASVERPVLQVLGSESPPPFADAARELDRLLPDGRLAVIEGARHAAHHTHVEKLAMLVESFLDEA